MPLHLVAIVTALGLLVLAYTVGALRRAAVALTAAQATTEAETARALRYQTELADTEERLHDSMETLAKAEALLAERDAALAEAQATLAEREQAVIVVEAQDEPERPEPLTEAQRKALLESKCIHCGGSHTIACPRVKRLRFRPDGQTPLEVEFWALDEWRTPWAEERIVWPEDMA